jgi:hypothetical protein
MTNKKNQKDQLAKLMATENLTIVHKKVPTAYFDMKNRILCCPIFKEDLSSELYDLFMGHEVGHALNTPYEGVHSALTKNKTLKGYLNVVEDVRIERKIRETYPGLRKSFYKAYNELMEMDFFGINSKDLNKDISLIDKINLITKVGSRVNIALNKEEQFFLDWSMKCQTWDEVEECATAIYEWSKENETRTELDESMIPQTLQMPDMEDEDGEEQDGDDGYGEEDGDDDGDEESGDGGYGEDDDEDDNLPDNVTSGSGDSSDEKDGEESTEGSDGDGEEEEDSSRKTVGGSNRKGGKGSADDYDDNDGARESITEHNAHNNEEQFISEDNTITSTILLKESFKKEENFKHTVLPYKEVLADFHKFFHTASEQTTYFKELLPKWERKAQISSKNLRDKNKKVVSHMAKEFEMKQTAMRSAKAFQGKTGKLDMNRLAKYQIVDDIFKKVTYLPDGKNHGLQVMLDWSGSIHSECSDLLEQAMVLVEFCRKVQIPHRVYLFSDSYSNAVRFSDDYYENRSTRLIELFSDKQSSKEYIKAHQCVAHLWNCHSFEGRGWKSFERIAEHHNEWFGGYDSIDTAYNSWYDMTDFREPNGYRLGGTPLDHCLTAMRALVPAFNSEYGIEKSILTVITDGFSHRSDIFGQRDEEYNEIKEQEGDDFSSWRTPKKRVLIDPFTNKSYSYYNSEADGDKSFDQTQNILDWISKETGCIVTGYFVLGRKQDLWNIYNNLPTMDIDSTWRQIRKEGVAVQVKGYNKLFLTSTSALSVAGDVELDDDLKGATKRKLLGAFKKNQTQKTTSRFLTNEFIKEIA